MSPNLIIEWCKLKELLEEDDLFAVDRYYFRKYTLAEFENVTVHGFSDASEAAFTAVIYIVGDIRDNRISNFVVSKTKVSPLKKISIATVRIMCKLAVS